MEKFVHFFIAEQKTDYDANQYLCLSGLKGKLIYVYLNTRPMD